MDDYEIISRAEAKRQGRKFYFTGKPCPQGHISLRYVNGYNCVQCEKDKAEENRIRARQWARDNKEYNRKRANDWYYENKERAAKAQREWQENNWDKVLEKGREWKRANRGSELRRKKLWRANNPSKYTAEKIKRRTQEKLSVPAWAEFTLMDDFYNNRPEGYHVDHVIPLIHPLVCGLHCFDNLQYLEASENMSKQNRFDPDEHERQTNQGP